MVLFGIAFGWAGFAGSVVAATGWMLAFGVLLAGYGAAILSAQASADASGLRYRFGLVRRSVASEEIVDVRTRSGKGMYTPRICIEVEGRSGKVVRLAGLQRNDTEASRAALRDAVTRLSAALRLPRAGEHPDQVAQL